MYMWPREVYVPVGKVCGCLLWVGQQYQGPCGCMDDCVAVPQDGKCGGELSLGQPVFPRPGSVPAVAQWFTALLFPGGNKMQDLRTTSIPNTPHVATKQIPFLNWAKIGYQGSCPGQKGRPGFPLASDKNEGANWRQLGPA
uniref:Uncharacterized protein n=1 Tax=Pipistrellus kuhlii TaxID=59472 RepID=A0A7J8B272_PIPKU|nr:hypothetical protein mPipKuh1_007766 [Pipistrellus kuhlii]